MILKQSLSLYKALKTTQLKKKLWTLGTAVKEMKEMEEIKSVKLRDNLKIHKRQTEHMVTSIQMMRNLFFAVANIISEHQSICKKFCKKQRWSILFRLLS